jgi:Flp pilus assembly protein TadG
MKNKWRHPGQSLVEFALVFPLVFFLTTSFLDLGRAIFYYSSLTNAVRETTRYAIVHKDEINTAYNNLTNNSLQDKVLEYAFGLSNTHDPLTKSDIIIEIPSKVNNYFTTVSIEATYMFKPITPGMKELFGLKEGIELRAHSKMLVSPGSK